MGKISDHKLHFTIFLLKLNSQVTFEFAIITLNPKTWQDMNGKRYFFFFFIPFRIGKGKSLYIQEKKTKNKNKNKK